MIRCVINWKHDRYDWGLLNGYWRSGNRLHTNSLGPAFESKCQRKYTVDRLNPQPA
jgi:hypothetical protein